MKCDVFYCITENYNIAELYLILAILIRPFDFLPPNVFRISNLLTCIGAYPIKITPEMSHKH